MTELPDTSVPFVPLFSREAFNQYTIDLSIFENKNIELRYK